MTQVRVGMGYDVHQLREDHDFWLGGVRIPHSKGSVGHSDADVLIHTLCDALLGAANLRDIGYHFPDTDPQYKGIDSKILLAKVTATLRDQGWNIQNLDATICLQLPKINPYIPAMKTVLAGVMGIDESAISIKATTTERLGFVGREEGVSAMAVALISR
jgi:2-C-methyl-D-erythritol 2,4-cyclodiphosphate synthase